jgi:muramoyltetrapeptide carboxypeptidase
MARQQHPKPPFLRTGAHIALIAPSFHFEAQALARGRAALEKHFHVHTTLLEGAYDRLQRLAGTDQRREDELFYWLTHPKIDAVWMIRGGYGVSRYLPSLMARLKRVKKLKPKILIAYSDLTLLLNALHDEFGWLPFHGPAIAGRVFAEPTALELNFIERNLFSNVPLGLVSTPAMRTWVPGKATAPMVGGNLSLVAASIGTAHPVEAKGRILFLEDCTEQPYRVDRLLTQALQAGVFSGAKGILLGQFTDCGNPEELEWVFQNTLLPFCEKKRIPLVSGFPAGHGNPQLTFPVGARVRLHAGKEPAAEFLEAGCGGRRK